MGITSSYTFETTNRQPVYNTTNVFLLTWRLIVFHTGKLTDHIAYAWL